MKYDHRYKEQLKVYVPPDVRDKLDELTDFWVLTNSALIEELIVKARKQMHSAYWREQ